MPGAWRRRTTPETAPESKPKLNQGGAKALPFLGHIVNYFTTARLPISTNFPEIPSLELNSSLVHTVNRNGVKW